MSVVIPVILCGGSGTRLWPLSRRDRPKQFVSLLGDYTLLEGTLLRAKTITGAGNPICVTTAAYGVEVRQSLDRLGLGGTLLLEPEPRNTASALCAAALVALCADPRAVIVAMPADHVIEEGGAFAASIAHAVAAAEGSWLTILGVRPQNASSALGYIVPGAIIDGLPSVHRVSRFVEKPEAELADRLVAAGALWNAGIVVARAATVIDALRQHEPTVLDAVARSFEAGGSDEDGVYLGARDFGKAPRISFDKAVLERGGAVAVTALDAPWRDVGTWGEVAELYTQDGEGNRQSGRVNLTSSHNSFVFSPHRLTVGIGLNDVIVVDTPDALLVANRTELGRLRDVVEAMSADYHPVGGAGSVPVKTVNMNERESSRKTVLATQIFLHEREILSREPHHDVARHWIVLEGSVRVTIGARVSTYLPDQSFHVPPGNYHQLESCGGIPAKLIEVHLTLSGP